MSDVRHVVLLALYHGFTRWLPPSRGPLGGVWRRLRAVTGGAALGACGHGVNLERGANIGRGRAITLGDRSGISMGASLHGPVQIGADVMMGPEVMIYALGHSTARTDIPMNQQGFTEPNPVVIEDDVWIGARAIILPGVRIGRGSVIGAGSVVTKSVQPFSVAAGNPAKIVRNRQQPASLA